MNSFTSDDQRWDAVCRRNPEADGRFVFAVRTTGIYCRPSCSARTPRRENVSFHADPEAAEMAGFRACRRCSPKGLSPAAARARAVAAACRLMENSDETLPLDRIAAELGFSPHHFHRMFKQVTGLTPRRFGAWQRARLARERIQGARSITAMIYELGFGAPSRFYDVARSILGMSPASFRAGGAGVDIRHATLAMDARFVLVAAVDARPCAILEGSDAAELERRLAELFPRASRMRGDASFTAAVREGLESVELPRAALDLPPDIRASLLEERRWQAIGSLLAKRRPGEDQSAATDMLLRAA